MASNRVLCIQEIENRPKNVQKQIDVKKCIRCDDIYNFYVLALELDTFIYQMDIFPNFDSIVGLKDIMAVFNDFLNAKCNEFQVKLGNDTTFSLVMLCVPFVL